MSKRDVSQGLTETVEPDARSILLSVRGRHETGKTTFLSMLIETALQVRPIRIIDADTNNSTLAAWFPHAIIPEGTGDQRRVNIEEQFNWIMDHAGQADLFADLGGDDGTLPRLGKELGYAEALVESGVDPVLVYVVGPDARHLRQISDMEKGKIFCPKRTVVVLNSGLIPMDRMPNIAYADVLGSETIKKLIDPNGRAARVVVMPTLDTDCMKKIKKEVELWRERGDKSAPIPGYRWALSADGRRSLGMTDHLRVKKFFSVFNEEVREKLADWIPA